jgi:hypothetical protein
MSDKLLYLHPHLKPAASALHGLSDDELLSLALDGELPAQDDSAWQCACGTADAHEVWQTNLLIGETLRAQATPARGTRSQSAWMAQLSAKLEAEAPHQSLSEPAPAVPAQSKSAKPTNLPAVAAPQTTVASNDRFWKLVAGGSVFTSVAALAFATSVTLRAPSSGVELAQAQPGQSLPIKSQSTQSSPALLVAATSGGADQTVAQVVQTNDGQAVILRDARMLEKMAQHRMLGSAGVHATNAFVRHAAFETTRCAPQSGAEC